MCVGFVSASGDCGFSLSLCLLSNSSLTIFTLFVCAGDGWVSRCAVGLLCVLFLCQDDEV